MGQVPQHSLNLEPLWLRRVAVRSLVAVVLVCIALMAYANLSLQWNEGSEQVLGAMRLATQASRALLGLSLGLVGVGSFTILARSFVRVPGRRLSTRTRATLALVGALTRLLKRVYSRGLF